jgi:hypothetical protein
MIFAKGTKKEHEAVLKEALERYKRCTTAEGLYRKDALEDQKFVDLLEQWPEPIKKKRRGKAMLVIDHLGTTIHQVVNDMRQNKLGIKVRPRGGGADVAKAKRRQAVIRYVENRSKTPAILDFCAESAVKVGEGYMRVLTEVIDSETNEQDILVKRIPNWCAAHLDPDRQEPDGSDALFGFIEDEVDKDAPEVKDAEAGSWSSDSAGATQKDWYNGKTVKIVEYFRLVGEGKNRKCEWYKLTASKVLDFKEFPSKYVPIVEVVGEEMIVEGKRYRRGLVRRSKDAQTMYNVMATAEAERTAQLPKGKWVGTKKHFEGVDHHWKGANKDDTAYLPFNVDPQAPMSRPEFTAPEGVPVSVINAKVAAREDIKYTSGLSNAALGISGPEKTGKAIIALQREGDTANFHYTDNLTRAVGHLGCIINDMAPRVFDLKRVLQIVGDDGKEMALGLNMKEEEAKALGLTDFLEDWGGEYEVISEAGPSYATKRQETAEALTTLVEKMPIIGEVGPDLVIESFDFDKATELADRIREKLGISKTGPDGQPIEGPAPDPAMVQAMQQMEVQLAATSDQLAAAQAELADKEAERQAKHALEIEKAKIEAWSKVEVARVQAQAAAPALPAAPAAPTSPAPAPAGSPAPSLETLVPVIQDILEAVSELRAEVAQLRNTAPAPVAEPGPAPAPLAGLDPLGPESVGAIQ